MKESELINEIKRVYQELVEEMDVEKEKNLTPEQAAKKFLVAGDSDHPAIFTLPKYKDLRDRFYESDYIRKFKWHHVVRLALEPEEKARHMYERILHLVRKHRKSHDDYFKITTKNDEYTIPPLADFNRLEILHREYYKIYQNIKNQINFDSIKKKETGVIRGKINWSETIQRSTSPFPIEFVTNISERKFVTPENILLIICAEWLNRESSRLLQISFKNEISQYERRELQKIYENSRSILENFPFKDIVKSSRIYWKLNFNHYEIKKLEKETKKRIDEKNITNKFYMELLKWINDFRELSIQQVSGETSTKNILEAKHDIDEMYEAWIFLEFLDYLHEKNILVDFDFIGKKTPKLRFKKNCRFSIDGKIITFWYERYFDEGSGKTNAWAKDHHPDFTAMIDDEILAVFDAKNYGKGAGLGDPQNKILAYMNNLNTNFGALFFPEYPARFDLEDWDKKDTAIKISEIKKILQKMHPESEPKTIKGDARKLAQLPINDEKDPDEVAELTGMDIERAGKLVETLKEIKKQLGLPYEEKVYPKDGSGTLETTKVMASCRMSSEDDIKSDEKKKEVLDFIFKSIVNRVQLTASS